MKDRPAFRSWAWARSVPLCLNFRSGSVQVYLCSMKTRIVAIAIAVLVCQVSLVAQNMPFMPVLKSGKLVPGDTLSVRVFRPSDKFALTLVVGVANDGTITVPTLDKVPAAGLSIMELNSALEQRYTTAITTNTPPTVTVAYLGHSGGNGMDKLFERIGKTSIAR